MAKIFLGTMVSVLCLTQMAIANDRPIANDNSAPTTARGSAPSESPTNYEGVPSQDEDSSTQTSESSSNKIDLVSILFDLNPELNISLGVERTDDDTYLIIEMDHNPTRSGFIFRFDQVYTGLITDTVVIGNGAFGFNNKPTAQLPMIETQEPVAKFILGSTKHRTHQRINLSKITRELSQIKRLMTSEGDLYNPKDIKDFQLLTKKPSGQGAQILELKTERLPKNQVHQISGTEKLTDLVELSHYEVGQEVKLKAHYKMPYRSSSTQWVIVPEKSDHAGLVYKLVKNPVAGDLYEVATIAEGFDRVLPKTKPGFLWVKILEEEGVSTFSLAKEGSKLSPAVLIKYVHHLANLIQEAESKKLDLASVLPQLIEDHMPVKVLDERMPQVSSEILQAQGAMQVLRILLREQSLYTEVEILNTAKECGNFLSQ